MSREAKKYRCIIITGYEKADGKFFGVKKGDPFVVVATSPEEARIIVKRDHLSDHLAGIRPKRARKAPGEDLRPLAVKQIAATAIKEDRAMEQMGVKPLFDLSKIDPG
jgi:hypothetical protein